MSDSNATLLPCPWCGGKAQVMCMDLDSIDEGWKVYGVWCVDDLHAEEHGGYQHGHFIDNFGSEAEAIEAWNSRAERTTTRNGKYKTKYGRKVPLCECCGYAIGDSRYNYCPNCGAKAVDA